MGILKPPDRHLGELQYVSFLDLIVSLLKAKQSFLAQWSAMIDSTKVEASVASMSSLGGVDPLIELSS